MKANGGTDLEAALRIGELAERTGVPARRLRYYEDHGLLAPGRAANGYREYDEGHIEQVARIRGLIDAGLPIAIIKAILPRLDQPGAIHLPDAEPELIAALERHHEVIDARIRCLARNRDALGAYIEALRRAR